MKRDQQLAEKALDFICGNMAPDELPDKLTRTQRAIMLVCLQDAFMLLRKNQQYGDSALSPMRTFSSADTAEQLRVRLDDKLSRIKTSGLHGGDDEEDTAADFRGYLVLEEIAYRRRKKA